MSLLFVFTLNIVSSPINCLSITTPLPVLSGVILKSFGRIATSTEVPFSNPPANLRGNCPRTVRTELPFILPVMKSQDPLKIAIFLD